MSHNPNNDELIKNILRQGDGLVENVFNSIKSQHELNTCNDGKRSSDVLVATLEKCERLQKQLDIAKEYIYQRAEKDKYADWILLQIEELNK